MPFTDTLKNSMLGTPVDAATHAGILTAVAGNPPAEVTGGSPAYARKAITWGAVGSGARAITGTAPTFDIPGGGTEIAWWGLYTEALPGGTLLAWGPLNPSSPMRSFTVPDPTNDRLIVPGHAWSVNQRVALFGGSGSNLPYIGGATPLGVVYFVQSVVDADTITLSTTLGGGAVDVNAEGAGRISAVGVETFSGQGQYTLSTASVTLNI